MRHNGQKERGYVDTSSVISDRLLSQGQQISCHFWTVGKATSTQLRVVIDIGSTNHKQMISKTWVLIYHLMEHIQMKDPSKREIFGYPIRNKNQIAKLMKEAENKGEVSLREAKDYFITCGMHSTDLIVALGVKKVRSFRNGIVHMTSVQDQNFVKCFHCYTCLLSLDDVTTDSGYINFWEETKGMEPNF